MADTDFANLPSTNALAAADQLLVVRNGAAYRFVGLLPAVTPTGQIALYNATGERFALYADGVTRLGFGVNMGGLEGNSAFTHVGFNWGKWDGSTWTSYARLGESTFRPGADNSWALGNPGYRWSTIYAGTGAINTSDARAKQQIDTVPDEWLDAWADVQWVRYRFNDAVAAKGNEARWHVGLIAQQVRDAFAARGLDAMTIGLLCHDEWEATPEVPAVEEERDDAGEVITPAQAAVPARPAGDRYGLRYDECQAIEAAYQRRVIARAGERERILEDRLAAMEAALAQRG